MVHSRWVVIQLLGDGAQWVSACPVIRGWCTVGQCWFNHHVMVVGFSSSVMHFISFSPASEVHFWAFWQLLCKSKAQKLNRLPSQGCSASQKQIKILQPPVYPDCVVIEQTHQHRIHPCDKLPNLGLHRLLPNYTESLATSHRWWPGQMTTLSGENKYSPSVCSHKVLIQQLVSKKQPWTINSPFY